MDDLGEDPLCAEKYVFACDDIEMNSNSESGQKDDEKKVENRSVGNVSSIGGTGFSCKSLDKLTYEEVKAMVFENLDDAEHFYMSYAKMVGFGVRRDDFGYSKGQVVSRTWVCRREGKTSKKYLYKENSQRKPKSPTRCGCNARFRVHKDFATLSWKVSHFTKEHNHTLFVPGQIHLVPSYRDINATETVEMESQDRAGGRASQIVVFGGYDETNSGTTIVYNYNSLVNHAMVKDGDANADFAYLRGRKDSVNQFFLEYSVSIEGQLEHMLWADGMCQLDFESFGDVLAFDSTYKENVYNRPLIVFSGLNHHKQTVVFGAAMLANEEVHAYIWALWNLIKCINGKSPQSVVTDDDFAMQAAAKEVFPIATHRLCKCHLQENAEANVQNIDFTQEFQKLANAEVSTHEWDMMWDATIYKLKLQEHPWIKETESKREYWAAAYLRGKSFCGVSTTSQCKGIIARLKKYLVDNSNLVEFMHHFDHALAILREKESIADFESLHNEPELTSGVLQLERHAAMVYSREAFYMFQKQLILSNSVNLVRNEELGDVHTYIFCKFGQSDCQWIVEFDGHPKGSRFYLGTSMNAQIQQRMQK